jgi:hypothetical protein
MIFEFIYSQQQDGNPWMLVWEQLAVQKLLEPLISIAKHLNLISPGLLRAALGPHPEVDLENEPDKSICSTSLPLSE